MPEKIKIKTGRGEFTLILFRESAPKTVESFLSLTRLKFYDGLAFHRVIPGFVVQGGDPLGDGSGGPGFTLKAEFNDKPHLEGTVAMARASHPNSAGSQFYICLEPQPHLDGQYTVFGQVDQGMEVIKLIQVGDTMETVSVIED